MATSAGLALYLVGKSGLSFIKCFTWLPGFTFEKFYIVTDVSFKQKKNYCLII